MKVDFIDRDNANLSKQITNIMATEARTEAKRFGMNMSAYKDVELRGEIVVDGVLYGKVIFRREDDATLVLNSAGFDVNTGELKEYTHFDLF